MANCELDSQPNSAEDVRFIAVDQRYSGQFNVYINDGNFAPTNTEFMFLATGR